MRLLGAGRRTAFINNALDMAEKNRRVASASEEIVRLKSIGLKPVEVDLRKYFGRPDELREALFGFDLIWARGGNTFVLRRAFRASGLDDILKELLAKDAIVYGGYSAGVCVLAPTLRGDELVDDANAIVDGYEDEVIWEGLGIVPYSIAPHYRSDHPESTAIEKTVEYYKANDMPFKALHDGEAIVIDGEKERLVG